MNRQNSGRARRMWQSVWLTVVARTSDEHLVVRRHRLRHIRQPEDFRPPVAVVDDGSHDFRSSARFRWIGPPWLHERPAR